MATKQEDLERELEAMTAEERRERIILQPEFRDPYNEITQPHRQFPVQEYLWEKWLPHLGPLPIVLYIQLRKLCYYNPETGEKRNWCWPKQSTLAKKIGVKGRQTVGRALETLVEFGFIRRERTYQNSGQGPLKKRGTDRYVVYFELPLVDGDDVKLLLSQMQSQVSSEAVPSNGHTVLNWTQPGADSNRFENRTHRPAPVDNSDKFENQTHRDRFENRTQPAVRKSNSQTITRTITKNVSNVSDEKSHGEEAQSGGPRPSREKQSTLTFRIGEELHRMSGDRTDGAHKSEGFHRIVASSMPGTLVTEALTATRDAVDDQRAGRKSLRREPSAFFAGTIKRIADREGISLGLKPRVPHEIGIKGPERPVRQPKQVIQPLEPSERVPMPEGAREALKALFEE